MSTVTGDPLDGKTLDRMTLFAPEHHPHGMDDDAFIELFTEGRPVVFAFHGYQRAIHEIVHGRPQAWRFHVRGFNEQGTTTTPFNMVVLNEMSRYHLAKEALRRSALDSERVSALTDELDTAIGDSVTYAREHFEDPPHIRDWVWSGSGS